MKTPKTPSSKTKNPAKKIISYSILTIVVLFLAYYLYKHFSDFQELGQIGLANIWLVIILAIFTVIGFATNGLLLDTLMRPFGLKLKAKESFGLAIVTNFYNTILPARGGMAARAIYLKKKHNFPYVHFLATLSAIYILIFLVGSIAGLISMAYIYLVNKLFNSLIFILFLAVFLFMISIIMISPKLKERQNKWINRFVKVINGWHLIKNNKRIIFLTVIISLFQLILSAIGTMITYSIFSLSISFFGALFIASIGSLSILVAVTPGNLGIGDAINVFSATLIGVSLTNAVAATILGRVIGLIVILILGPIFSYILIKKNKNEPQKN